MNRMNDAISGFADKDYSLVGLMFIIISFFGILWMALKGIPSGILYLTIVTSLMALTSFIINIFIKEKDKKYLLSIPFTENSKIASIRFWLGFVIPFILSIGTGGWFISSQVIAPFVTFDAFSGIGGQSFATLSASYDKFTQFFIGVFTAGSIEESILGFILVSVGLIIAYFILKETKFAKNLSPRTYKIASYSIAFIISMGLFTILHTFNGTYTSIGMFLIAGAFRILMNLLMFFFLGIEFTIGFHIANNLLYFGVGESLIAILTNVWGWIIFIPFFVILIYLAVLGILDMVAGRRSFLSIFSMKS